MAKRILIIDDERLIVESVSYNLKQEGYEVISALDGKTGLQLAETEQIDLILLDLMLPGISGTEICRTIRKTSDIPIIMLTAKEDEIDRVLGLALGADDYVTKPFSMRELMARVKTVLKRMNFNSGGNISEPKVLRFDEVEIDFQGHEVYVKGKLAPFSGKEFELLKVLIDHSGQVLTREQLLNLVWGNDYFGDDRTVDVHIRWLREKIENDPGVPKYIITIRGVGYKFSRISKSN
jgi:DNA-binding response OmpR family regulator